MLRESSNSSNESNQFCSKLPHLGEHEIRTILPLPQTAKQKEESKVDLRLLQSHRLSHVAETGQLIPRTRHVVHSGDWSDIEDLKAITPVARIEPEHYLTLPQPTMLPPPEVVKDLHEQLLPDLHLSFTAHEGHDVATAEKLGRITALGEEFPVFSVSTETLEAPEPAHSDQPFSHERRNSQVVRKVNSSFEILRPGTLGPQPPEPRPPTDVDKNDSRRHSHRLRKNRTSTGERTRLSFI
jgi:hypothetical protein